MPFLFCLLKLKSLIDNFGIYKGAEMAETTAKKKAKYIPVPPPAPKGNKYALGNDGGRPQEYDRVKIAQDLIEWARKPDSINLNKFCAYNDPIIPSRTMLNWVNTDPEFKRAYEQSKTFLAFRREEMLNSGELHVKAYDLNATVYDLFHRAEKVELDDMDAERKKKVAEVSVTSFKEMLDAPADDIKQR